MKNQKFKIIVVTSLKTSVYLKEQNITAKKSLFGNLYLTI